MKIVGDGSNQTKSAAIGTLQLIHIAVTRKCSVDGSVVGVDQAVSFTEVIKAVTPYAAGQIGMQDRLGTLEEGKEADSYDVDHDKIMDIEVSEAWAEAKMLWLRQFVCGVSKDPTSSLGCCYGCLPAI